MVDALIVLDAVLPVAVTVPAKAVAALGVMAAASPPVTPVVEALVTTFNAVAVADTELLAMVAAVPAGTVRLEFWMLAAALLAAATKVSVRVAGADRVVAVTAGAAIP